MLLTYLLKGIVGNIESPGETLRALDLIITCGKHSSGPGKAARVSRVTEVPTMAAGKGLKTPGRQSTDCRDLLGSTGQL